MGRIRFALLACLSLVLLATGASAHAQSPQPQVVGGNATTIEQYPWQAAIVVTEADFPGFDAFDRQYCGGSLITRSIVLTAAHCVADGDPDCTVATCNSPNPVCTPVSDPPPEGDGTCKIDPDDVNVVLGVTTLSTATAADERALHADVVDAEGVSIHPGFVSGNFQNDLAYLVLQSPATLSAAIAPIDIAGNDEAALWAPGVLQDVSGWGSTSEGGGTVNTLRSASVPIVADSTCLSDYGPITPVDGFDPATMVCAGFQQGGVDTCSGDSGGPLEAPLEGGGYRLVGITSWGDGCARPDAPGVYTRIAQAAPDGLRDDVVTTVDELEAAFVLTDEEIVGNGGQARSSPPSPPPSGGSQTAGATIPIPTANNPYAKCQKLKPKKKRKNCLRKVRASLGQ